MTRGTEGEWRGILAVVRRDLRVVRGSRPVVLPMLIVPALLLVVMPLGLVVALRLGGGAMDVSEVEGMLALLPGDAAARVLADPAPGIAEVALVYLLSPLLLIVPLMTASVVAADAIAGERERRTLEGLLLTPLSDRAILLAKVLGAWLAALAVGVLGGVVYAVVAQVAVIGFVDHLLFPNVIWAGLVLWLGPAVAAIGLGLTVIVSARVRTVQEAFQIAGVVVLPVVAVIAGQSAGVFVLSSGLLFAGGAVAWLVAGVVLFAGRRSVTRARLGERL